ncbi:MAG: CoA activase [Gammaproteobacteria bacterium]|nr:CoA activase [Gammaproteobacteria bacterium]
MKERYIGIDAGTETIKAVELTQTKEDLFCTRREIVEHHKEPELALERLLSAWDWESVTGAAVTGRLGRQVSLQRVPTKQALASGFRYCHDHEPVTLVSIGSHGFSVLELRESGAGVFRENSRCSQGTGNFLRQLVGRFELSIEEAGVLCENTEKAAPLSGRCPVILKTDMTHLANKGENKDMILAGLYDAVSENVQVLLKPEICPPRVLLTGGVARSKRVRDHFRAFLAKNDMALMENPDKEYSFLEATGAAVIANKHHAGVPELTSLFGSAESNALEQVPALRNYLHKVTRIPKKPFTEASADQKLILGFDIGSTGSKALAIDGLSGKMIWEDYISTSGNPVSAAQTLMKKFVESKASAGELLVLGVTGSGREIVGSLMTRCYGSGVVFVLNEIAAHAEGAAYFDKRVDTIFEIGGQDAKYVRLADGRVIDAAMNEACSAGTGSFIEEQGSKFSGIENIVQLGKSALDSSGGVSLGQHCSVFMAEIIDEAVADGIDNSRVIAGIYDSIIQNYLNRVKGSRSVGKVIFCQGMPFAADALAASVVRQTDSEVIVPPNPGTIGALGIGLLTRKAIELTGLSALKPERFLGAEIRRKDTFVCKSKTGCAEPGNKCRIDRIRTEVETKKSVFTWGGGCSLWDKGTRTRKVPDQAPEPFREREKMLQDIIDKLSVRRGKPVIALTDEFGIKAMFPFFAVFLYEMGFDLAIKTAGNQKSLKRGIESSNIPFCAPMQLFHGITNEITDEETDYVFLPMMLNACKSADEELAVFCPIVQGSSDMLQQDIALSKKSQWLSPVINIGDKGLVSKEFIKSCRDIAERLGAGRSWKDAYETAVLEQTLFETQSLELGKTAIDFAAEHKLPAIVVLGRPYTIYNKVLNSNVPAILREQGTIAIPVDCYPVDDDTPIFPDMYWGSGQRNLRAAHQIRRTKGLYSLWCSNYSCGPDSFNLHFFTHTMEGKPLAIIETDGHSGDAGTKTRVEAFLHCVREDTASNMPSRTLNPAISSETSLIEDVIKDKKTLVVPWMGVGTEAIAACFRSIGVRAEAMPLPTQETITLGRRHTSGKECLPMTVTLGALLQRIESSEEDEKLSFFMPHADGPCRFGVYHLLHKLILERVGLSDKVSIWSPNDDDYFVGAPGGLAAFIMMGLAAGDMLLAGLYHVRPIENKAGIANKIHRTYQDKLILLLENSSFDELTLTKALYQVINGKLFGIAELLREAAKEYADIALDRDVPTILMAGELYVRCNSASNDFIIERLEAQGVRSRFAPLSEWVEYTDYSNQITGRTGGLGVKLSFTVKNRILNSTYNAMKDILGWPERTNVKKTVDAGSEYIRPDLLGEGILTVGSAIHEDHEGLIDGMVNVSPFECMHAKIAEAQLFHVSERNGLITLTVTLNGDPLDAEIIDNFAFEVKEQFKKRTSPHYSPHEKQPVRRPQVWQN